MPNETGDLGDAIALLRRKRDAAESLVSKYNRALAALAELEGDLDGHRVPDTGAGRAPIVQAKPSVSSKAIDILNEEDRVWTVAGIIQEYDRRGAPVEAADPANALRTALATLVKRGQAVRESPGFFRSTKFSVSDPSEEDAGPREEHVVAEAATQRLTVAGEEPF